MTNGFSDLFRLFTIYIKTKFLSNLCGKITVSNIYIYVCVCVCVCIECTNSYFL